jgi:hypothetical protein
MSKHTPGPWIWGKNYQGLFGAGPDNEVLHFFPYEGMSLNWRKSKDADARLIAAAPDLLEALKAVVRVADRKTDEFDAARAAIKKAEGA